MTHMGIESVYVKEGLEFQVWAQEDRDSEPSYLFVPIAPNLAICPRYVVEVVNDVYRIRLEIKMHYSMEKHQLVIWSCRFSGSDMSFDGMRPIDIQKFPIDGILRSFFPDLYWIEGNCSYMLSSSWDDLLQLIPFTKLKEQGPTDETLKWVSRVYGVSAIRRNSPTKTVSELFNIPLRTASHWVKLMRERIWPDNLFDRKDVEEAYGIAFSSSDKGGDFFRDDVKKIGK